MSTNFSSITSAKIPKFPLSINYVVGEDEVAIDTCINDINKELKKMKKNILAIDLEMNPQDRKHLWVGITNGDKVWLFVISKCTSDLQLLQFNVLLGDSSIIKVFHDFGADKRLLTEFGTFDTFNSIIDTKLLAFVKGEPLALDNLAKLYECGNKVKVGNHHNKLWSENLLSEDEMYYLSNDVFITFNLVNKILYNRPTFNEIKQDDDYDIIYKNTVNFINSMTNKPNTIDKLQNVLINSNSAVTSKFSGSEVIKYTNKLISDLLNNRIINRSGMQITYQFSEKLLKDMVIKIHLCPMCNNNQVDNIRTLCINCARDRLKYDKNCKLCYDKVEKISKEGISCVSHYGQHIINCDLCDKKLLDILNEKLIRCNVCRDNKTVKVEDVKDVVFVERRELPKLIERKVMDALELYGIKDDIYVILCGDKWGYRTPKGMTNLFDSKIEALSAMLKLYEDWAKKSF